MYRIASMPLSMTPLFNIAYHVHPEITGDDREIYPEFVVKHGLSLLFREELVQDVIHNVLHQKPSATDQEILEAIIFYDTNDTFMDFNP